ncbi:hypothetical protein HZU83_20625 [Sphaerotilus montanus]|uniref:hypothetical protein n=1 Tax=Sphaerotilus montanus TaxID=522889 RepID=UPI0015D726F3|nr:hypothetical protein [Sphaerotilus montanus]NZD59090.1 hypothetical protein [Sphaerotilus montanus]
MKYSAAWVILTLLAVIHLIIGSSILVIFLLLAVCAMGIFSLSINGMSFGGCVVVLWTIYYGWGSMILKAFLFQPLQDNLIVPEYSALIVFLCTGAVFLVATASNILTNKAIFTNKINLALVNYHSHPVIPYLLLIGIFTQFLHLYYTSAAQSGMEKGEGFGGFSVFHPVYLLSVSVLVRSINGPRRLWAVQWLVVAMVSAVILSVVGNVKKILFDVMLTILFSAYVFNIKIKYKYILPGSLGMVLLLAYMGPVVLIMRQDAANLSVIDRVAGAVQLVVENNFSIEKLSKLQNSIAEGFEISFRPDYAYFYPNTINADRYSLISVVDQVARVDNLQGLYSISDTFQKGVNASLPLVSKDPYTNGDLIAWAYGLRNSSNIARPVMGQVVNGYVIGGILGAVFYCAIFVGVFIMIGDMVFGGLNGGVVPVVAIVYFLPFPEQTLDTTIIYAIRNTVSFLAVLYLYVFVINVSSSFARVR